MGDVAVLPLAVDENRVILTFDLDFGDLAVRRGHPVPGVILLRIRTRDPLGLMAILQTA
jgi:predicted nuclease of predicted toxin-antitoxin system